MEITQAQNASGRDIGDGTKGLFTSPAEVSFT